MSANVTWVSQDRGHGAIIVIREGGVRRRDPGKR